MNSISVEQFDLIAPHCRYFDGYSIDPRIKYAKRIVYDYEVEYYIGSNGGIEIDGEYIKFEEGSVNFRKPGQVVRGVPPYSCYLISLDILGDKRKLFSEYGLGNDKFAQPNYSNTILNSIPNKINNEKSYNIMKIMKKIYDNYTLNNDVGKLEVKTNLYILLNELYRISTVDDSTLISYNATIKKAVEYMKQNYNEKISIDDVAMYVGLSKNYFHKTFKDSMGETPNKFISNLRIKKAKYLLSINTMSVSQVASECGFFDNVYFSYVFKKKEGITPSNYRNAINIK